MKAKIVLILGGCLSTLVSARAQLPTFTQNTTGDIVNHQGNWVVCGLGDFHNNGFLDLVARNATGTNAYYQNSSGMFLKISQGDPLQDSGYHVGAHAADYDNGMATLTCFSRPALFIHCRAIGSATTTAMAVSAR